MSERQFIVVDVETSGLDPETHTAVEIAWWNLSTGERGYFIPQHNVSATLANAEIKALQINCYVDRIADQPQDNGTRLRELGWQLHGNTLAGSNPSFDADFLRPLFSPRRPLTPRALDGSSPVEWHHRKWDLAAYAAAVLKLGYLPGLSEVCETLDVVPSDHTADGDVTATGRCFIELFRMVGIGIPGGTGLVPGMPL